MIASAGQIALVLMSAALVLNLWRLLKGPSIADRIIALDTMYINSVALLVLLGIVRNSTLYFEAALIMALLGFVGTVALCLYVLRRDIMD
jgi:multicomponent K+:H+ antiporter subunit F